MERWVKVGANKNNGPSSSSKLLRPELPLSRHGRGNKLASTIVNPRSTDDGFSMLEIPFKGREIVAYNDLFVGVGEMSGSNGVVLVYGF